MRDTPIKVVVGVTGGIAAYKSAELIRRLREKEFEVRVVMTRAAREFITPLTLQALSGYPVRHDLFDEAAEAAMGHIELARWADVVLVAPASADFIAKLAHGFANDLLSTLCLATAARVIAVPAMNRQMWASGATQENCSTVLRRGVLLLGPAEGDQACGEVGPGRMLDPVEIVSRLAQLTGGGPMADLSVLVTAGPTQEAIDPVRYVSNYSSGKMGYAIAQAAADAGALVTLVSGPTGLGVPSGARRMDVLSAEEMYRTVMALAPEQDIFIGAAAVADYRPDDVKTQKIKKTSEEMVLRLARNPDILAAVAALPHPPFTVGFAAETENLEQHAREKLEKKSLDLIAANQVNAPGIGFGSEDNALQLYWRGGSKELPRSPKPAIARELIQVVYDRYRAKNPA